MNAHAGKDETRAGEQSAAVGKARLGEMLGASESGPAGKQVENRPGRPLAQILRRLGLTP